MDRGIFFAAGFPLPRVMETRGSSYFVFGIYCILSGKLSLEVGSFILVNQHNKIKEKEVEG